MLAVVLLLSCVVIETLWRFLCWLRGHSVLDLGLLAVKISAFLKLVAFTLVHQQKRISLIHQNLLLV